jgi:hypothetical protein
MSLSTTRVVVRILVYTTLVLVVYGSWYAPHWPMRYAFGIIMVMYIAAGWAVLCNWDKD